MRTPMRFETKAKLGYVLLVLVLAAAMIYTTHRLSSVAEKQVAALRAEEQEVTLVERLRWTSELVVSTGRAYLLSGEPALFRDVQNARARLEDNVRLLREVPLSATGQQLVEDVEQAAESFMQTQDQLMSTRETTDASVLARRFDTELFPRSVMLERALGRLVDHKEDQLAALYAKASGDRARLAAGLDVLLGMVVLAGIAIAWGFARLLGRAYKQEEEALRAARTAVAARDELMGIVAHDLRSPLAAITMRASILRQKAASDVTRDQAASIENVAMRMEYLIKTMLDVVTMESGQFTLLRAPCGVQDLVREVDEMFQPLAAAKHVRLESIVKDPGLVTHADRERVLQVLANLIGNALKFTPQGGHVTVIVERTGDEIRFAVLDTGPGITPEHVPRIFDRFWKYDTPGIKGTGLGLFIAKAIVEAHGGRIWAESEPGHGARFYFTLARALGGGVPVARTMPSGSKRGP